MNQIRLYVTIVIASLLAAYDCSAHSLLKGSVMHSPSKFAVLLGDTERDTIPINADGSFLFDKPLTSPGLYTFMVPGVRLYQSLWIERGKLNELTVDAEDLEHADLKGDAVKEAEFINTQIRKFNLSSISQCTTFKDFMSLWQKAADSLAVASKALGNPVFAKYVNDYAARHVERSAYQFMDMLVKAGRPVTDDKDFTEYMQAIDVNDISNMNDNLTFHYLRWKSLCRKDMASPNYYAMLKVLSDEVSSQEVRDEYGFRLLRMYLTSTPVSSQSEEVYKLANGIASERTQKRMQQFYLNTVRPAGSLIQDFDLLDTANQKHSFHKICDRPVVYIDIWSTWCGPCCKEIPYVAKLVERYKDRKDIKFVSISIDKNLNDWKKFLDKHHPAWEQYVVPKDEQDAFLKRFAINGIPRFMVIDSQSRIVNLNTTRPSAAETITYLDSLLK